MQISELELPQYLFTEDTDPDGTVTRLIAPDRLVSWAEEGRGDAISRLCRSVYESELANIDAWEHDRMQQLEDEWKAAGSDEGMPGHRYVNVRHYHTSREDIVREAEMRRVSARERMAERQTAVDELVREAREFLSAWVAQQDEDNMLVYLIAISATIAVLFSLIN